MIEKLKKRLEEREKVLRSEILPMENTLGPKASNDSI
jgi:hypothetical protein